MRVYIYIGWYIIFFGIRVFSYCRAVSPPPRKVTTHTHTYVKRIRCYILLCICECVFVYTYIYTTVASAAPIKLVQTIDYRFAKTWKKISHILGDDATSRVRGGAGVDDGKKSEKKTVEKKYGHRAGQSGFAAVCAAMKTRSETMGRQRAALSYPVAYCCWCTYISARIICRVHIL